MLDLSQLQPLIVPVDYVQFSTWDLPHVKLPNSAFVLTWVHFAKAMLYIDRAEYEALEVTIPSWQQQTFTNVRHSQYFHQYSRVDEQGQVEWLIFLNDEDAISSSKILLQAELQRIFPQGYQLALPDRACGVVISMHCTGEALVQVQQLVTQLHAKGSTPMSAQIHPATDFALPADWTAPLAEDTSSAAILEAFGCS